jgi:hypothetical protein
MDTIMNHDSEEPFKFEPDLDTSMDGEVWYGPEEHVCPPPTVEYVGFQDVHDEPEEENISHS